MNAQELNTTTLGLDMAAFGMGMLPIPVIQRENTNKQQYRAFSTDYEWPNRRDLFSSPHSPTTHGIQKGWKLRKSQCYLSKLLNEAQ